jgi:hypothetical protein
MSNSRSLIAVADAVGELETSLGAIEAVRSLMELEDVPNGRNTLLTVDRVQVAALLKVLTGRMSQDIENVKEAIRLAEGRQTQ